MLLHCLACFIYVIWQLFSHSSADINIYDGFIQMIYIACEFKKGYAVEKTISIIYQIKNKQKKKWKFGSWNENEVVGFVVFLQ